MEDKLKRHEELCKQIHETFVTKNNDYGDSVHELLEKLGPITLATRLGDKYNRICSLLTKGLDKQLVKSESILDTFLDLANYAIIGYVEMEQYLNNLSQYPIDKSKVNTDIILPASTTDNQPLAYSVITDETHCDIVDDEKIKTVKCPLQKIGDNQVAVVKRSKSIDIQTGDELFSFPLSNCLPIDTPSEYFRTQIPIDSNSSTVFVLVPSEVFKMEDNTVKLYQKPFGVIPAKEVKEELKIELEPKKDGYKCDLEKETSLTIPFSYFVKSFIEIYIGDDITDEKLFNEYVNEINERFYNNLDKCNLNNETDKCTTLDSLLSVLISCISAYNDKIEDTSSTISSTCIYNFANFINPLQLTKQIFEQRFIYDKEQIIYNTKEKHIKFKAIK